MRLAGVHVCGRIRVPLAQFQLIMAWEDECLRLELVVPASLGLAGQVVRPELHQGRRRSNRSDLA